MFEKWGFGATPLAISGFIAGVVCYLTLRLAENWCEKTRNSWDDRYLSILKAPMALTIVILTSLPAIHELPDNLVFPLESLAKTLGLVTWGYAIVSLFHFSLSTLSRSGRASWVNPQSLPLLNNVSALLLWSGTVYFVLMAWEVDPTAWIASAGIVGIAIGFAAKDTLANLFSGVFILADHPYRIGDYIVLDGGERGEVTMIGLRSTRIRTRSDVEVTIPNSIMGSSKIINESSGPDVRYRIALPVRVAYGSDIDKVRALLLSIPENQDGVSSSPEPRVRIRGFGESGLHVELLVWVERPALRGLVQDALNERIYKRFLENGVEIPYSTRKILLQTETNTDTNKDPTIS